MQKEYYYSNDDLKYYKAYDKLGGFYDCLLPIVIKDISKEITDCSKSVKVNIKLEYSSNDVSVAVIIGSLNDEKHLLDTLDMVRNDEMVLGYEFIPNDFENHTLQGLLLEIDIKSQEVIGTYFFEYEAACK